MKECSTSVTTGKMQIEIITSFQTCYHSVAENYKRRYMFMSCVDKRKSMHIDRM